MDMIAELFQKHYLIIQLFISPSDLGLCGISRKRTYIYLAHRTTCRYLIDVHDAYAAITKVLRRKVFTRPSDYFVATPHQVQSDALKIAECRGIPFRPETWNDILFGRDWVKSKAGLKALLLSSPATYVFFKFNDNNTIHRTCAVPLQQRQFIKHY